LHNLPTFGLILIAHSQPHLPYTDGMRFPPIFKNALLKSAYKKSRTERPLGYPPNFSSSRQMPQNPVSIKDIF